MTVDPGEEQGGDRHREETSEVRACDSVEVTSENEFFGHRRDNRSQQDQSNTVG